MKSSYGRRQAGRSEILTPSVSNYGRDSAPNIYEVSALGSVRAVRSLADLNDQMNSALRNHQAADLLAWLLVRAAGCHLGVMGSEVRPF